MKRKVIRESIGIEFGQLYNNPINEICQILQDAQSKLMAKGFKEKEIRLLDEGYYEDSIYCVVGERQETDREYIDRLQTLLNGKRIRIEKAVGSKRDNLQSGIEYLEKELDKIQCGI